MRATFCLIVGLVAWNTSIAALASGLPAKVQMALAEKRDAHKQECAAARVKLLDDFEAQAAKLKAARGMKAEVLVAALDALKTECDTFSQSGCIPFSPQMRGAAQSYIAEIQGSKRRLICALDKASRSASKSGDMTLARKLIEEKQNVPTIVGRWDCQFTEPNGQVRQWRWNLFSDGTANAFADDKDVHPKSWMFGKNGVNIVIINVTAKSPKGGFRDTCKIHPDGQKFDALNQLGGVYTGVRCD